MLCAFWAGSCLKVKNLGVRRDEVREGGKKISIKKNEMKKGGLKREKKGVGLEGRKRTNGQNVKPNRQLWNSGILSLLFLLLLFVVCLFVCVVGDGPC